MLAATLAEGKTVIRPAAQEPEVDDLIAFLREMGAAVERTAPDTIVVEGRKRLRGAAARGRPGPHRGRHLRRRRGRHRRPGHAPGRAVRPPRRRSSRPSAGSASASSCGRDTIEVEGSALARGAYRARRHRDGAVPRPRHRPPAADRRPADPGDRTSPRPRDDLRGPPRVARRAAPDGRRGRDARPAPRRRSAAAALRGAEVEIGDLRAGASLILAALAAEGTSIIHGAHHVRRGYENIERKFHDLGASIARVAEGTAVTTS